MFAILGQSDERFDANLITFYGVVVFIILVSLVFRRTIGRRKKNGTDEASFMRSMSEDWLPHLQRLVFWSTVAAISLVILVGAGYHMMGRDVRHDFGIWYDKLTNDDLINLGLQAVSLFILAGGCQFVVWMVRRIFPSLEKRAQQRLGRPENEASIHDWFVLCERFVLASVRLYAVWLACHIAGLGYTATAVVSFILRVLAIVAAARLLTLACRSLSKLFIEKGEQKLGNSRFRNYWIGFSRLIPFTERCFETAIYVVATTLCAEKITWIDEYAVFYGPRIVRCIWIFFVTRVIIEAVQILVSEAFGYREDVEESDSKGRTLVPLLHSISQYVLYFGSFLMMLDMLGINTAPIMAGAGIIGLAVGLGAQSLVTDVVSGFFILFENQYFVGDHVKIGDATGRVEALGIRVTHIRDEFGKLHIIPNGNIRGVVSSSKSYVHAVVDLKVPRGSNLEQLFRAMTEAGRQLRQKHKEVLADTVIQGLVDLGSVDMTARAVTKVKPGSHAAMQNEYRRLLKQILDETQAEPRLAA